MFQYSPLFLLSPQLGSTGWGPRICVPRTGRGRSPCCRAGCLGCLGPSAVASARAAGASPRPGGCVATPWGLRDKRAWSRVRRGGCGLSLGLRTGAACTPSGATALRRNSWSPSPRRGGAGTSPRPAPLNQITKAFRSGCEDAELKHNRRN